MQELTDVIRSLANGNVVGPDRVSVELIKITLNGDHALRWRLLDIVIRIWRGGEVPPHWEDATIMVCVLCVCVFSSHSFWTSSSLDVPAGVTQEEGHTGFLIRFISAVRALIFLARRIQPFLSLIDREVEFCVL